MSVHDEDDINKLTEIEIARFLGTVDKEDLIQMLIEEDPDISRELVKRIKRKRSAQDTIVRLMPCWTHTGTPASCSCNTDRETINCGICLESINTNDCVTTRRCGHVFHRTCLTDWFVKQETQYRDLTCPICREDVENDYKPDVRHSVAEIYPELYEGNNLENNETETPYVQWWPEVADNRDDYQRNSPILPRINIFPDVHVVIPHVLTSARTVLRVSMPSTSTSSLYSLNRLLEIEQILNMYYETYRLLTQQDISKGLSTNIAHCARKYIQRKPVRGNIPRPQLKQRKRGHVSFKRRL